MNKLFSCTTAICLALFSLSPIAQATDIDNEKPVIENITTSSTTIAPGATVTFYVDIKDASPITFASISIAPIDRDALEQTIYLKKNDHTNLFEGTYTVPTTAFNEKWKVTKIHAKDVHGNYTSLIDQDLFLDNWESTVTLQIFDGNDTVKPKITGLEPITIDALQPFNPLKDVTAIDDIDGNITQNVAVSGNINTNVEGTYTLTYSVKDKAGNETAATREVTVKDLTKPTISFPTSTLLYNEVPFDALQNVTAFDTYDGDVTSSIKVTKTLQLGMLGDQQIHYEVTDQAGNKTTAVRTVTMKKTPDFGLQSIQPKAVLVNTSFDRLEGIQLFENGQAVKDLRVEGDVNTQKAGVYTLTYSFTTTTKQTISQTRAIHVVESLTPYFTGIQDVTLPYGKSYSPLQYVQAFDATGAKIINIRASYGGDITQPGTHEITYTATDSLNQTITETVNVTVLAPVQTFKDVAKNHSAYMEIEAMKAKGIINGYSDGTFKPSQNISRQHVASLIYRSGAVLTPIRPATTFKDVPKTHSYYTEIMALYRAGIIDGSNGSFNPSGNLTRAQLSKILVNAFDLKLQAHNIKSFSDVKAGWAKSYVDILSSNNITTGSNGQFMPNDFVSRAHYAKFMYRIIK